MKTLLVDDERLARNDLRRLLASHSDIEIVGEAADARSARALIANRELDLIFLDVQMPGENGFDLLKSLTDSPPPIIFVTAFDRFALKAFEFGAYDYLLKPIEPVRLAACLTRLRDRRPAERIEPGTLGGPLRAEDQVFVREGESCWMIQVSEIELLDAVENYTRVHFRGRSALVVRSLAALEDRLDPRLFFRANRQQIINLRGVQKIQPWFSRGLLVVLNSCVQVQISRRRSLAFRELKSL
jgi:two-component system, LytTR family, response regulator